MAGKIRNGAYHQLQDFRPNLSEGPATTFGGPEKKKKEEAARLCRLFANRTYF
jgi:hypothetical protein